MSEAADAVVGYDAPRFIEFLIQGKPEIRAVKLFQAPISKPIQGEPWISDRDQALISEGLALRESLKLPFWDSLFLHPSNHAVEAEALLKRATVHNLQDLKSCAVPRINCTETYLRSLVDTLAPGHILAMSSKVVLNDERVRHIPMLDFHCPASTANDALVKGIITQLGVHGYVSRSGRSYHFYGCGLVDESTLISFLATSLLFSPIVDRA